MWPIAAMAWRIGDLLAVEAQLDWMSAHGFTGAAFHASAGVPGVWQGVEPTDCSSARREQLRATLRAFRFTELHAPFRCVLGAADSESVVEELVPTLDLAGDVEADVVTVHLAPPAVDHAVLSRAVKRLDELAAERRLRIGLEAEHGFDLVRGWDLPRVGVTLDIGHLYAVAAGRHLAAFGSLSAVVQYLGPLLVHAHVHDVDAQSDHTTIGTGCVDFASFSEGLAAIGYAGGLTLELNPDRASPEAIAHSRRVLEAGWGAA